MYDTAGHTGLKGRGWVKLSVSLRVGGAGGGRQGQRGQGMRGWVKSSQVKFKQVLSDFCVFTVQTS